MSSILWATSFRPFGISEENDKIQNQFLECISNSANVHITLCVTQFGEQKVEEALENLSIRKRIFQEKPPIGFKYSQTTILANALREYRMSGTYDHLVWSTCDFTFDENFLFKLTRRSIGADTCSLILPQHNVNHRGQVNRFEFNFGIDFFIFKLGEVNAEKFEKLNYNYLNRGWGCFEHFLASVPHILNIPIRNRYSLGNIRKFENDRRTFGEMSATQIKEWKINNEELQRFLVAEKKSKLFATGSMYYLFYKSTQLSDLSPSLILTLPSLFFKLFSKIGSVLSKVRPSQGN